MVLRLFQSHRPQTTVKVDIPIMRVHGEGWWSGCSVPSPHSLPGSKRQGQGECRWADGSSYVGEWDQNVMHGVGVWTDGQGKRYEGSFDHGKRSGFGTFSWPNGEHSGPQGLRPPGD
jgi:hypothetical protein